MLHVRFLLGRGCFSRLVGGARIPDTTLENGIYQFEARSGISLKLIQDYLDSHPLRSKKALSYSKWRQVLVELPKFKELLRGCKALPQQGETRIPHEEYQKLVALVQDINPSELKKRVGTRTSRFQAPREDLSLLDLPTLESKNEGTIGLVQGPVGL